MSTSTEIIQEVKTIFKTAWTLRDGRVVPDTEKIGLGNNGMNIKCAVLYADMIDSTGLVDNYKAEFSAEIYKAYLIAACRVIKNRGGEITAFDGDRVMAVFIGSTQNTSAVKTALQINYIVNKINSELKIQYPTTSFQLHQSIGIDSGNILVAKTGIRNSNDLVWVGRAANYAAKLCALGNIYHPVHITETVYSVLAEEAKTGGQPKRNMWEKVIWNEKRIEIYRTNWWWEF